MRVQFWCVDDACEPATRDIKRIYPTRFDVQAVLRVAAAAPAVIGWGTRLLQRTRHNFGISDRSRPNVVAPLPCFWREATGVILPMKITMAQAWHRITETVTMASFTQGNGGIVRLAVEMLSDGRAEWTMQYGGHQQRSGISSTFDAATAAAEKAASELETARAMPDVLPP